MKRIYLFMVAFMFGAPAWAEETMSFSELSETQREGIAEAEEVGRNIYIRDQAAWIATDYIREHHAGVDPRSKGWITEMAVEGTRVLWIGDVGGQPKLLQQVTVDRGEVLPDSYVRYDNGAPMTAGQRAAYLAIRTATAAPFPRCEGIYNVVVLPRSRGDGTEYWVYLLRAMTDWSVIKVGGHVMFRVDGSGTRLLETRPLSRSCLEVDQRTAPSGAELVVVNMTHLVTETPTPAHVFLNIQHKIAFSVATTMNGIVWMIEDGHIQPWMRLDMPQ